MNINEKKGKQKISKAFKIYNELKIYFIKSKSSYKAENEDQPKNSIIK